jgi:hypothetical protein
MIITARLTATRYCGSEQAGENTAFLPALPLKESTVLRQISDGYQDMRRSCISADGRAFEQIPCADLNAQVKKALRPRWMP